MPHILVSDCDNPYYAKGTIIISVLSLDKAFQISNRNSGMYGIDEDGKQTEYTNSLLINHYLIKDCTAEEFCMTMLSNSSRIKKPVNFRIVDEQFVEKKPLVEGAWPRNKVDLEAVAKTPCYASNTYLRHPEDQPEAAAALN